MSAKQRRNGSVLIGRPARKGDRMPLHAINSVECALSLGSGSDGGDPAHQAMRLSSPTHTQLPDR